MQKKYIFAVFFIILLACFDFSFAQDDKYKAGLEEVDLLRQGIHNFGRKDQFNIEVSAWGMTKLTGRFIVPKGTTLFDLVSYSGGPTATEEIQEIRIFRQKNDSLNIFKDELITFKYEDFVKEDNTLTNPKNNPVLMPGDIVIFLGTQKVTSRDILMIILQITTVLVSVGTLLVTILRK
ncbi:MAG: hypothetical protein FJ216_07700 [Ignavibacteria bacterium]|nr:hypothetical protein [Ignavibacteria bacterium]